MALSDAKQCESTAKRTGKRCRNPAVSGSNVCRAHGAKGGRPIETGRYSKILRGQVAEKIDMVATGDPTDLLPELQVQRALFAEYINRFDEYTRLTAEDIHRMMNWSESIGRMVERIVKQQNETALTAAEIRYLQARIVDTVRHFIDDTSTQQAFIRALFGVTGDAPADARVISGTSE